MRKGLLAVIAACLWPFVAQAQESQEVYSFLRLPVSAHVAALGGDNITLTDDDPTLIFHNPALINDVSDKSLNLNFMTYMEGAKTASASFVKAYKERATWGVAAQYMDYGAMKETTERRAASQHATLRWQAASPTCCRTASAVVLRHASYRRTSPVTRRQQ